MSRPLAGGNLSLFDKQTGSEMSEQVTLNNGKQINLSEVTEALYEGADARECYVIDSILLAAYEGTQPASKDLDAFRNLWDRAVTVLRS